MKKVIQSILIFAVAFGSFLSPLSVATNQNTQRLSLQKNEALAGEYDISFILTVGKVNDTSAEININIKPGPTYGSASGTELFGLEWSEKSKNFSDKPKIESFLDMQKAARDWNLWDTSGTNNSTYADLTASNYPNGKNITFTISKSLDPEKEYYVRIEGFQFDANDNFEKSRELTRRSFKTEPLGQGPSISGETGVASEDLTPSCGLVAGSLYGCIIQIFYYIFWVPTNWLAALAGKLLDFFVFYSISSSSYNQSGFVNEGWKVVRDIANIAFIFILLYIALRTILNLGGSDNKKMIVWVVIIALLINFSLFFTKIVVDSGNILAGVLYNNIGISAQKNGQPSPVAKGENREEEVSVAIVNQFDPQKLVASAGIKTQADVENMKTTYLFIIILATIVNIFIIMTFLSVVFLFVGRTVGLMISMIFAPFAFISLTIPGSGSIMKQWSWGQWFKELVSVTFMAPIFIFFLWLILKFLDVGILKGLGEKMTQDGNVLGTFIAIILPMILVLGLLKKAKEIAQEMAGEVGNTINSYAGKAIGVLGGAALGGAAFLGRATVGRLATSAASRGAGAGGAAGGGGAAAAEQTVVRPPILPIGPQPRAPFRRQPTAEVTEPLTFNRAGVGTAPAGPAPFLRPGATPPTVRQTPGQILEAQTEKRRLEEITQREVEITDKKLAPPSLAAIPEIKIPAEEVKKTTGAEPVPTAAETTKSEAEKAAVIGGKKADITSTTEALKEQSAEEKKIAEETQAAKEAELQAEAKSLKDMAAAAPKSVFDLIKSKNKGEDAKNMLGKQAFDLAKYLGSASFDMRGTKLAKFIEKQTGFDLGKGDGEGGFSKMQENIIKNEEKYAKSLSASGKELENLNKMKLDLARFAGQQEIDAVKEKIKRNEKAIKEDRRNDIERLSEREEKVKAFNDQIDAEDKKIKTKTAERQKTYADRVEKGGMFGYTPTQQEAALKIRAISKEKSSKDKIFEEMKKVVEEDKGSAPVKPAPATPSPASTPPSPSGGGGGPKK